MTTAEQLEAHQKTVDKIEFLLSGEVSLRSRELDFVTDMGNLVSRGRQLSLKQRAYLDSVYNRALFQGNDR